MFRETLLSLALNFILLTLLAIAPSKVAAAAILKSNGQPEFAEYLQVLSSQASFVSFGDKDVVVTLGRDALTAQLTSGDRTPVIAILVTSATYKQIVDSIPEDKRPSMTAIYLEPNPLLQIALAQQLSKQSRILVARTTESGTATTVAEGVAKQAKGVELLTVVAGDTRMILQKMDNFDILVALPDKTLFNASTMQPIVSSLCRRQKFMIGFSKGMTDAGALGAVSVEIQHLIPQLKAIADQYLANQTLPPPSFSTEFSVYINKILARSLSIYNNDELDLHEKVASTLEAFHE